ncbi:hypothetical protein CEXT_325711, partial [Caerostris extrusa]
HSEKNKKSHQAISRACDVKCISQEDYRCAGITPAWSPFSASSSAYKDLRNHAAISGHDASYLLTSQPYLSNLQYLRNVHVNAFLTGREKNECLSGRFLQAELAHIRLACSREKAGNPSSCTLRD